MVSERKKFAVCRSADCNLHKNVVSHVTNVIYMFHKRSNKVDMKLANVTFLQAANIALN